MTPAVSGQGTHHGPADDEGLDAVGLEGLGAARTDLLHQHRVHVGQRPGRGVGGVVFFPVNGERAVDLACTGLAK